MFDITCFLGELFRLQNTHIDILQRYVQLSACDLKSETISCVFGWYPYQNHLRLSWSLTYVRQSLSWPNHTTIRINGDTKAWQVSIASIYSHWSVCTTNESILNSAALGLFSWVWLRKEGLVGDGECMCFHSLCWLVLIAVDVSGHTLAKQKYRSQCELVWFYTKTGDKGGRVANRGCPH